jgi:peptide/nickel transport system permease protein
MAMTTHEDQALPPEEVTSQEPGATTAEDSAFVASQWQLMWWRFRKHKLALVAIAIIVLFYFVGLFCEFIAPYHPESYGPKSMSKPPDIIHFRDLQGHFHLRPFIYGTRRARDPVTLHEWYILETDRVYPIYLLAHGDSYKFWGLFETDVHLFGIEQDQKQVTIELLGGDSIGRDQFSRLMYGIRISGSVGLVGVIVSLVIGVFLGGISGYRGGTLDMLIQRFIEFLRSIPTIPLWMSLAAAVPPHWPPVRTYFAVTIIISFIGWTGMARVVRGRFLSLREEDFVTAARISGSSQMRIIMRHMAPSVLSYIIASVTLSIPEMILSETSLSYLGLGLRPPAISLGILLQQAQAVEAVANAPWMLMPAVVVVVVVLSFNFLGDGLRDAADPYSR